MRSYSVLITDPNTGAAVRSYTSWVNDIPNGQPNPAALDIKIDALVTAYATPGADTGALVQLWGISLQDIASATNLVGMNIKVYAGMSKGLPLENPAQYGLIVQGQVYQAFGNWVGVNMTLDIVIVAPTGGPGNPVNLSSTWKSGVPLSSFLVSLFAQAFPNFGKPNIQISKNLVPSHDIPFVYHTLSEFAAYLKGATKAIVGGDYSGVDITLQENSLTVYDGTSPASPKMLSFLDLVGQPTWIAYPNIQIFCVMRGDLSVGDYIQIPQGLITTTGQALTQFHDRATFNGVFLIYQLRHVGDLRQPAATSWVTIIEASPAKLAS